MSQAQPGYLLTSQVPPKSSFSSKIMNVLMSSSVFNLIAVQMPENLLAYSINDECYLQQLHRWSAHYSPRANDRNLEVHSSLVNTFVRTNTFCSKHCFSGPCRRLMRCDRLYDRPIEWAICVAVVALCRVSPPRGLHSSECVASLCERRNGCGSGTVRQPNPSSTPFGTGFDPSPTL
jgi:hypothetical protein